jgi:hypothetical protein
LLIILGTLEQILLIYRLSTTSNVPKLFQNCSMFQACSNVPFVPENSAYSENRHHSTIFDQQSPVGGKAKIDMKTNTNQAVSNTLEALNASEYIVRLIHGTKPPISKILAADQLLKQVAFYQAKNREGYNVYFRPVGYQFILLDDLERSTLQELARLKPCLLLETSPNNYQAWLKLQDVPSTREQALQICKELAQKLGADMGSAEPDHIGRLPGFTNRKPKHQQPNGLYPFVKLHKWEDRESSFSPHRGIVGQTTQAKQVRLKQTDQDRSRADFNLCCMLINQGKTDDYIRQELEVRSDKAKEIKASFDYIGKTIKNARSRLLK